MIGQMLQQRPHYDGRGARLSGFRPFADGHDDLSPERGVGVSLMLACKRGG